MNLASARVATPLAFAFALALTACTAAPTETVFETVVVTQAPGASPSAPGAAPHSDVEACRLPSLDFVGVGLGQPRDPNRLPSTGDVSIAVVFVDFSDAPASVTAADRFAMLSPGAESYYDDISGGALRLRFDPDLEWHRMSKKSTRYSVASYDEHKALIREAIELADPGFDFSRADGVLVMVSDTQTVLTYGPTYTGALGEGIVADGNEIYNGVTSGTDLDYWGGLWAAHELGHSLGLPDLYDYEDADLHGHVGGFSLMGDIAGFAPELLAYSRWQLGWLDETQVVCADGLGSEYAIAPVAAGGGGTKVVLVPISDSAVVAIESRRAIGYDAGLPKEGVLVYVVDTGIPSGHGQVEVYPQGGDRKTAPLGVGESITVEGVEISVVASDADGDTVYVGYAGE